VVTLNYAKLDAKVALFRAKSPNVAAAFDETKALLGQLDSRLAALEQTPPAGRTVTATTRAELDAALAGLRDGDEVLVTAMDVAGQLNVHDKRVSATVRFGSGVRFTGMGGYALNCVWIRNCAGLRLYGGDLSNPQGNGFKIEDSDVLWHGWLAHDLGGHGGICQGLTKPCRVDLSGVVVRNGMDLSLDPHAEKGTGLHGVYLGAGSFPVSGSVVVNVHDLPAGAGVEVGNHVRDMLLDVNAARLTKVATQQKAGAAIMLWGTDLANVRVRSVVADSVSRVVETDGLGTNPPGAIVVEYGRGTNVRLSPSFAPHPAVSYLDCV
jgi:hypothetical protein